MKNLTSIILVFAILVTTSCKKNKIENTIENSTWKLITITLNEEDKTQSILENNTVFATINFEEKNQVVTFSESTRPVVLATESGNWSIEKIIPTVGDNYYLIKNSLQFSEKRSSIFNLGEYGSQVELINNKLVQEIDEYIITYEKVN